MFSLLALAAGGSLLSVAVVACSNGSEEPLQNRNTTRPEPPGACVVTRTALVACEAGAAALPDAALGDAASDTDAEPVADAGANADPDAAVGDASAPTSDPDAAFVAPASENRCLVTEDVTVACPNPVAQTAIAAGRGDTTDILVAERGLAYYENPTSAGITNDDKAYFQVVHLASDGTGSATLAVVPPYSVTSPPTGGVGIASGSASTDSAILAFSDSAGGSALRTGTFVPGSPVTLGAPFDLPRISFAAPFTSANGEGILTLAPLGGDTTLTLVRGLPGAPRVVTTMLSSGEGALVRTDPAGVPAAVAYRSDPGGSSGILRLLEGETLGTERWTSPSRDGAQDLAYITSATGNIPVLLLGNGTGGDTMTVKVLRSNQPEQPYAQVGVSYSTCTRSTYLGITCDACPVSESCETGNDEIHSARLFTRNNRVFAAYYATDVRHRKGYSLDTTIFGVGCVCAIHERDTREYADSLVVVEIAAPANPAASPVVIERMRLPLYKARTGGQVTISPRPDGDLDVLFAPPASAGYDTYVMQAPETPPTLRVLRISTAGIP